MRARGRYTWALVTVRPSQAFAHGVKCYVYRSACPHVDGPRKKLGRGGVANDDVDIRSVSVVVYCSEVGGLVSNGGGSHERWRGVGTPRERGMFAGPAVQWDVIG